MSGAVLVVEDDRELREVVRRYLERAGHAVRTTGSGAAGERVGTVRLGFSTATSSGRTVAWSWVTDLSTSTPVHADADRLHQAVTNLLSNAARYCRPGDQVSLSSSIDGRTAVLDITDTGPGIPADELPHVFDRLWRGQHARAVTGSGIGLAVVRELITAHGGTVTARSPAGSGTTITIRLPLTSTPANVTR